MCSLPFCTSLLNDRKGDTNKDDFSFLPTTSRPCKDHLKPTSSSELMPFALTVSFYHYHQCTTIAQQRTASLSDGSLVSESVTWYLPLHPVLHD